MGYKQFMSMEFLLIRWMKIQNHIPELINNIKYKMLMQIEK